MELKDFKVGKKYRKIEGREAGSIVKCVAIDGEDIEMESVTGGILGWYTNYHWFAPVEEEFEFGDMLKINDGAEYAYLGKTAQGNIITMTRADEPARDHGDVKAYIWSKSSTFEKVVPKVEVTMEEIATAMNIDVKNLKIVK